MALKLFELEAVVGLDDSAYRQGIQNVQSDTKKTIATLSSEYSKAAKAVVALTQRYNESVAKTGKTSSETKNLKAMLAQAEAQLKATTTALKAANNGMDGFGESTKTSGESLAGAMTKASLMSGVLSKLGSAALDAAKSFIQSGIDYNAQIEKYTVGFTNMLGSAEAAQQAMAAIQEDAAKTPFNVEALTQANQLLISAGENAGYSRKVIMALGNAVNAAGGGNAELSRMAQNLQQIANVGKAASIDIKQFAYAGINIYQVLADYTGKSVQEVQNMTISYDLLSQALIAASEEGGRYYGAMETQSQTMNGRMSTLQDNVKQLAGLMTSDLTDAIGKVIEKLNEMTTAAMDAYKQDGWWGMADAALSTIGPINKVKQALDDVFDKLNDVISRFSYWANSKTMPNFAYGSYEEYENALTSTENRERRRQNALAGKGISNKSWSERQAELAAAAGDGGSSITTSPTSTTGKKSGSKSTTETVIASVSNTVTTSAMNALGAVTTSVQTLQEKVKDAAGNIKDRVTTTTTETGKEMVNGVATTYKQVQTVVDGVVTKTTKVYDDMSKTLSGTLTKIAESTFNGITTKIQDVTEKYADGSEHIKRTETETGERIVDGVAETYEKVITYIDGVKDKVTETATAADNSVKGIQSRIEKYLGDASGELDKGVFGLFKSFASDIKNQNWGGLALDVVDLIWGEVSQGQREILSKWAADALAAINEAYSGGGLSNAFDAVQAIFGDNGIFKTGEAVTNIAGVTDEIKSFGEVISGLAGSGGVGGALGSIVQSFSGMAGGITSALGTIVSFIASNPILALILGVGAVAGGIGLALWAGSQKAPEAVSHYKSPFEDNGVYDSLSEFSTRSAMQYRVTGQRSAADKQTSILERIEGLLDEHLPDIGTGQVVMDSGELVGVISPRMATNVDARIGVVASRKARGV